MSISALSSTVTAVSSTNPVTIAATSKAAGLATLAVTLSGEEGVVANLGGSTPTLPSTSQLYDSMANAGLAMAAPAIPKTDGSSGNAGASSGTGTSASIDVNAEWASAVKSSPKLAPLLAQLTVQQALVDTLA